jgi:tRNA-Thr(GGU) m(6)t(6)A37 methyltransferase TsaA
LDKNSIIELRPIGVIHSPYKTSAEAPCQGRGLSQICKIEIFTEYETGLKDIEGFSHLIILYYFHQCETQSLLFRMPLDIAPHGIFTTRLPNRPNPLGLSVVTLVSRHRNILHVKEMDAADSTPVLDIKPYIPGIDERRGVRIGWLKIFWPGLSSFEPDEDEM